VEKMVGSVGFLAEGVGGREGPDCEGRRRIRESVRAIRLCRGVGGGDALEEGG
jgi:hypothetical protein